MATAYRTGPDSNRAPKGAPRTGFAAWFARNKRPVALVLLTLAAALWGVTLWRGWREAPAAAHIRAGMGYIRQEQSAAAEREWLAATQLAPNNVEAWELLGELYTATKRWPLAVNALQRVAQLKPDTPSIFSRLALAALRAGADAEAFTFAEEALKRDPKDEAALAVSILLLSATSERQKYLERLKAYTDLAPDDQPFLILYAQALYANHKPQDTRRMIDHILTLNPHHALALAIRGVVDFEADTSPAGLKKAEKDFQDALAISPDVRLSYLYLGKVYLRMNRPADAVRYFEEAGRRVPNRPEVFFELVKAYKRAGDPARAKAAQDRFNALRDQESRIATLKKRVAAFPENAEYPLELGLLRLNQGEYGDAGFYLSEARMRKPDDPRPRAALAELSRLTGMPDRAALSAPSPKAPPAP